MLGNRPETTNFFFLIGAWADPVGTRGSDPVPKASAADPRPHGVSRRPPSPRRQPQTPVPTASAADPRPHGVGRRPCGHRLVWHLGHWLSGHWSKLRGRSFGVEASGWKLPGRSFGVEASGWKLPGRSIGVEASGWKLPGGSFGVEASGSKLPGQSSGVEASGSRLRGRSFRVKASGSKLRGRSFGVEASGPGQGGCRCVIRSPCLEDPKFPSFLAVVRPPPLLRIGAWICDNVLF